MSWFSHRTLALSMLAVSLGVTGLLWQHEQHNAALDLRAQLDANLRDASARIEQRMAAYTQMLRGAQGLFGAAGKVGRKEFRVYIDSLQLGADFSGMGGVGFTLIVPHARKDMHVAALRKQGFPEYAIKPEGERAVYAPVIQIEPFVGRNQRGLGFDSYAIPTRRIAMDQARDSGSAAITDKVQPMLESGTDVQPGFVMFLPVYKQGMPHDTVASRRAGIIGWLVAPIRMNILMASLYGERAAATDISIYDGVEMSDQTLLYDSAGSHGKPIKTQIEAIEYFEIAGRTWTLAIRALPGFEARLGKDKSGFIAIAGVGLSLLLALFTWNLAAGRERARIQNQALREAKERFELIFNGSPDSALITRLHDGVITDVNHGFTANTGYTKDDAIGKSTLDLNTWVNLNDRQRCVNELLEKGYSENVEAKFQKKDGVLHTGIISARVVVLHGVQHGIWFIRDITARKQIEDALRKSEQRLTLVLACAELGTWDWDFETGGVVFNQRWAEMRGLRLDAVEAHVSAWEKNIHPDDLPALRLALADHLENRSRFFQAEYRVRTQSGQWLWIFDRGTVVGRDAEGNPLRMAGIEMDITERRRSESELHLRGAALEATANAIIITDRHGLIEWANPAFRALTGYTREEALGHNPRDLLKSGIQAHEHYGDLWRTILAGKVWHGELVNRRKDGSHYHEDQIITPVRDKYGAISHFVAVKQDITERKLNEARMNELSRHLVELQEDARRRLAGELHDRTSPNLAAIGINLNVMAATLQEEGSAELAARLEDTRALIEDTTASIREICADLRPPVLDYAGLLAALESYAHQFARRTGIAVQVDCSNRDARLPPELESALFRIAQEALTNCAKHARTPEAKAGTSATSIRVTLCQGGRPIVLTVADNGVGFDPDRVRAEKLHGGLGIITMKELAEFSGGTFTLESSPGKGTRIGVEIDSARGRA